MQIINNEIEEGAVVPDEWEEAFWGVDAIYTPIVAEVERGYYNFVFNTARNHFFL